jgi:hypothetical protein
LQIFTQTLTFGASGFVSLSDLAGNNFKATRIHVEPANANTHVSYMSAAPSAGLIHQFQIPDSSNKVPLDQFDLFSLTAQNDVQFNQFQFSGTEGEALIATVFVA